MRRQVVRADHALPRLTGRLMPELNVTAVDIGILLAYVLLTRILFGWWFARKTRGEGAESYFWRGARSAGRSSGSPSTSPT